MLKKIVEIAHDCLLDGISKQDIAIDFTCGSGHDTQFLCERVKHVYSYDIQLEAIKEARKNLTEYDNVTLLHKSHEFFDEDVSHFDRGIFNLGYYPKGDKAITTNAVTVIKTLEKALKCLNPNGKIIIVCYPGFEKGYYESIEIEKYLMTLSAHEFDVFSFRLVNRNQAPYIFGIEKHKN
ncbi:MAG: class I SAM-dependent methyltransferase [Traorella sp.]